MQKIILWQKIYSDLYPQVYCADEKLTTFWLIFQNVGSKGCFRLLFCKASPEKLPDLVLYAKDHSVAENIQMNIQLINFNILLGLSLTSICPTNDIKKINNNTNIHLDLRQIGCYCIRPTASHNNSQYCRRSR